MKYSIYLLLFVCFSVKSCEYPTKSMLKPADQILANFKVVLETKIRKENVDLGRAQKMRSLLNAVYFQVAKDDSSIAKQIVDNPEEIVEQIFNTIPHK